MPALDSGSRHVPSDRHLSIQLDEAKAFMASLLPTQELPSIDPPLWKMWQSTQTSKAPQKIQHCLSQCIRVDALPRIFFEWQGMRCNIEEAPKEFWMFFLVGCKINIIGYDEGQGHPGFRHSPGLYRRELANQLLAEGKLQLLKVGYEPEDKASLLIASPAIARTIVTAPICEDLARDGQWDTDLCCKDCHEDASLLTEYFLASDDDPLGGHKTRRRVFLCCNALQMIDGWYPNRIYSAMPIHGDEDCF